MSESAKNRAAKELVRARKSLLAAMALLEKGLFEDCVSRAYYAVLHAAKAALATVGVASDTHNGVRRMFGLHLVKTGRIEREFAGILTEEHEDREIAEYDVDEEITEETARSRAREAEKFVQRVEQYLRTADQT
ncbi:MAG: HEPN domain-containing protein [Planctomycetes bacterium]|nr:HEPN domain-containing protein [Planctomycetota bacterium]MBM4079203.1 HEPN domain-containing protein [Planctomycetota bacterium]MBM4084676.1 HEPN domain-containing protein [Planctomycetota bacterium]